MYVPRIDICKKCEWHMPMLSGTKFSKLRSPRTSRCFGPKNTLPILNRSNIVIRSTGRVIHYRWGTARAFFWPKYFLTDMASRLEAVILTTQHRSCFLFRFFIADLYAMGLVRRPFFNIFRCRPLSDELIAIRFNRTIYVKENASGVIYRSC